jgi:hypothetical protein
MYIIRDICNSALGVSLHILTASATAPAMVAAAKRIERTVNNARRKIQHISRQYLYEL